MLRKLKASKIVLTSIFTLLLFVSWFVPNPPASLAQVNGCPGNIVVNGNFTNGLSNWLPYGTPDLSTIMGCNDPGYVGMWGNQNPSIGEGLGQALNTVPGQTYIGSICFRRGNDPGKQPYAMLRLRASPVPLSSSGSQYTIYVSPMVTSLNWASYPFTLTATSNVTYLTINVENNSNANDGAMTSYGHIDNLCIREATPDFTATKVCQGQTTSFTSNAPGATSWDWNFGDGTTHSSQQNPAHTYVNAGTFNVTLCVNGTTNCVTKLVTVAAAPPAPIISGPSKVCGWPGLAPYSVPAAIGVTYSWSVTNGTIVGASTGNSVNVNWNGMGVGTITVTATNKAGCTSSSMFRIEECRINPGDCCLNFKFKENATNLVSQGGGLYNFSTNLSVSTPPNIIGVTANIISSSLTYSPASCGVAGPVNSYVVSAPNAGTLTALVQPPNGHEVFWQGNVSTINNVPFQMLIKFPPPPTGGCTDSLTFCVKYTFTDLNCKTCAVIRCYGPFKRGGGPISIDDTKNPTQ